MSTVITIVIDDNEAVYITMDRQQNFQRTSPVKITEGDKKILRRMLELPDEVKI